MTTWGGEMRDADYFRSPYHSYCGKTHRLPAEQSRGGRIISSTSSGNYTSSYSSSSWGINDSEAKRRKRVAMYKAYAVENKFKASLRKGVRWFKTKYCEIVHGC